MQIHIQINTNTNMCKVGNCQYLYASISKLHLNSKAIMNYDVSYHEIFFRLKLKIYICSVTQSFQNRMKSQTVGAFELLTSPF